MKDLFKQFRDNLERRPPPAFQEQDWRDLEKRLHQKEVKRPAFLAWWWLALPLLMLSLGANVLLYRELRTSHRVAAKPETERDTVFQTQVMYKTDTVYLTHIAQPQFSKSLIFSDSSLPLLISDTDTQTYTPLATIQPALKPGKCEADSAQLSENAPQSFDNFNTLDQPSYHYPPIFNPPLPAIFVNFSSPKQTKTFQQRLYTVCPKRFYLSTTGGWAYPVSEDLERQGGFTAGLEAAVELSSALRMWMGANYSNTRLVTDRMDAAIGIPPVAAPSDDFTFIEAEAPQPVLEYGIGMQYLFNTSHKFKPFLGVGYGMVTLLPYEVVYDFENKPLGIEWSFEKNVDQSEFLANLLLLRAGFEYEISKKWNWQLRATYHTGFEKTGFQSPDILGIQVALQRQF